MPVDFIPVDETYWPRRIAYNKELMKKYAHLSQSKMFKVIQRKMRKFK